MAGGNTRVILSGSQLREGVKKSYKLQTSPKRSEPPPVRQKQFFCGLLKKIVNLIIFIFKMQNVFIYMFFMKEKKSRKNTFKKFNIL